MKVLLIALFVIGSMFSLAGCGEKRGRRKNTYYAVAAIIWVTLLILANTAL